MTQQLTHSHSSGERPGSPSNPWMHRFEGQKSKKRFPISLRQVQHFGNRGQVQLSPTNSHFAEIPVPRTAFDQILGHWNLVNFWAAPLEGIKIQFGNALTGLLFVPAGWVGDFGLIPLPSSIQPGLLSLRDSGARSEYSQNVSDLSDRPRFTITQGKNFPVPEKSRATWSENI